MKWAVKWRSDNRLDGKRERLVGVYRQGCEVPYYMSGYGIAVFKTRELARTFMREHYGYISGSPALRREPHGWMAPQIVKVVVSVEEVA